MTPTTHDGDGLVPSRINRRSALRIDPGRGRRRGGRCRRAAGRGSDLRAGPRPTPAGPRPSRIA